MSDNGAAEKKGKHSQAEHHMNIAPSAVGASLTGKDQDFLLFPLFESCQNSHGCALEAVRFGLGLHPGADSFLSKEINILLLFEAKWGKQT